MLTKSEALMGSAMGVNKTYLFMNRIRWMTFPQDQTHTSPRSPSISFSISPKGRVGVKVPRSKLTSLLVNCFSVTTCTPSGHVHVRSS